VIYLFCFQLLSAQQATRHVTSIWQPKQV